MVLGQTKGQQSDPRTSPGHLCGKLRIPPEEVMVVVAEQKSHLDA